MARTAETAGQETGDLGQLIGSRDPALPRLTTSEPLYHAAPVVPLVELRTTVDVLVCPPQLSLRSRYCSPSRAPVVLGCARFLPLAATGVIAAAAGEARAGLAFVLAGALVVVRRSERLLPSALEDAPSIAGRIAIAGVAAGAVASDPFAVPLMAIAAVLSIVTTQALVAMPVRRARSAGRPGACERVVIVGHGPAVPDLVAALSEHPEFGLQVVGTPVVNLANLSDVVDRLDIDRVIIVLGDARTPATDVARECQRLGLPTHALLSDRCLGLPAKDYVDVVFGISLLRLRRGIGRPQRAVKRAIDLALVVPTLVLTAPVLAATALAVRMSGPGPVLFRQNRVGRDGRQFVIFKFRSMQLCDDGDHTWNVACDGRVTPVGRLIRRTNIDELPQLFNVLRGDMSLIGPRPERPVFVDQFASDIPNYSHRHRVNGGLTGAAQIRGLRGDTSIPDRARVDNNYIDTWTFGEDIRILLRTVRTFVGRGPR